MPGEYKIDKGEKKMNVKKNSIGLLFLILALVVVPGAMALPAYNGTGNHPLPVTSEEAVNCKACHVKNGAPIDLQTCSRCHVDPYPTTVTSTVTAAPTVAAAQTPATPGFGIVAAMVGLFALALQVKRNNK